MAHKEIDKLIEKYFEGQSSLQEERMIREYYQTDQIDDSLLELAPYFQGLDHISKERSLLSFEEETMMLIQAEESKNKGENKWIWRTLMSTAASVIILFGAFFFLRPQPAFEDSFEDPQIAYAYAEDTIEYMAIKYKKGLRHLSKFDKIEMASNTLNSHVSKVNEGLRGIKYLNKYQQLIKEN